MRDQRIYDNLDRLMERIVARQHCAVPYTLDSLQSLRLRTDEQSARLAHLMPSYGSFSRMLPQKNDELVAIIDILIDFCDRTIAYLSIED